MGLALFIIILTHPSAVAQHSSYSLRGLRATNIEEVLALPNEEINLATAIAILYKEWDVSFDVTGFFDEIGRMALEIGARISPEDNPEQRVSIINYYLFEEKGYSYAGGSDLVVIGKKTPTQVIRSKKGDCVGLSLLYLVIVERLGLPFFHGVMVPEHVFVRYDNGEKRINIEPTVRGWEYEDNYYEKEYNLYPAYQNDDLYLRNLSKREVLGVFLSSLGIAYGSKEMFDKAIVELKRALEINPHDAGAHYNLGIVYLRKEMFDKAIAQSKKALEINSNLTMVHNNLAVAYFYKGQYDLAIAHFDMAIHLGAKVDRELFEALELYRKN